MSKRIIIFCDGTWNKADQKENGQRCPTNVIRLFEATDQMGADGRPQIVLYVTGVGTENIDDGVLDRFMRWVGGGFGFGISKNIKEAYRFIASNYEPGKDGKPGDDIFIFGFSRGAYTARSILGMLYNVGILRREKLHLLNEAYDHYRDPKEEWRPESPNALQFKKEHCHEDDRVAFLGVWDTVGSLGAPFGFVLSKITDLLFHTSFHVTTLNPKIEHAYHALAIDERRWPFRPTHLEFQEVHHQRCAEAKARNQPAPYEEKWFPGVHSNIGGGYPNMGLSDCALEWMIEHAERVGMGVKRELLNQPKEFKANTAEKPENSMTAFYRYATIAFVDLFKPILKIIWKAEAPLLAKVKWGEYSRLIENQGDVRAAIESYPNLGSYEGSLSRYAIKKLKEDSSYRPPNINL